MKKIILILLSLTSFAFAQDSVHRILYVKPPLTIIDDSTIGLKVGTTVKPVNGALEVVGATGTTDYKNIIAPATPNQSYVIAGLPARYADYAIFLKGIRMSPAIDYKASGTKLTFIIAVTQGDKILYQRLR